jgi:hypothetical protein
MGSFVSARRHHADESAFGRSGREVPIYQGCHSWAGKWRFSLGSFLLSHDPFTMFQAAEKCKPFGAAENSPQKNQNQHTEFKPQMNTDKKSEIRGPKSEGDFDTNCRE